MKAFSAVTGVLALFAIVFLIGFMRQDVQTTSAGSPKPNGHPVVVELFTSEGCSSCPPADALLKTLSERQPIPGTEIIALEEHVDYWDHLGWKDPFSSSDFTDRQNQYATVFGGSGVYTPQMVVDGHVEFVGSRSHEARDVIQKAATLPKLELQAMPSQNAANDRAEFDLIITNLSALGDREAAELWIAVTEKNLRSEVKAGENSGETLQHAAVVREIKRLDSFQGPGDYRTHASVKFEPSWQRANLAVVFFATEKSTRKIIGAISAPGAPMRE